MNEKKKLRTRIKHEGKRNLSHQTFILGLHFFIHIIPDCKHTVSGMGKETTEKTVIFYRLQMHQNIEDFVPKKF